LKLPSPRKSVVFREVPEGAILFCTETEVYFSLNQMGVRVWRLLPPECASDDEIVSRLSAEFPGVNLGTISGDIHRLISDLLGNGLVEVQRAA
jgi:coenzyme PQQ synthesis protein D (PqqD)